MTTQTSSWINSCSQKLWTNGETCNLLTYQRCGQLWQACVEEELIFFNSYCESSYTFYVEHKVHYVIMSIHFSLSPLNENLVTSALLKRYPILSHCTKRGYIFDVSLQSFCLMLIYRMFCRLLLLGDAERVPGLYHDSAQEMVSMI